MLRLSAVIWMAFVGACISPGSAANQCPPQQVRADEGNNRLTGTLIGDGIHQYAIVVEGCDYPIPVWFSEQALRSSSGQELMSSVYGSTIGVPEGMQVEMRGHYTNVVDGGAPDFVVESFIIIHGEDI